MQNATKHALMSSHFVGKLRRLGMGMGLARHGLSGMPCGRLLTSVPGSDNITWQGPPNPACIACTHS